MKILLVFVKIRQEPNGVLYNDKEKFCFKMSHLCIIRFKTMPSLSLLVLKLFYKGATTESNEVNWKFQIADFIVSCYQDKGINYKLKKLEPS